MKRWLMTFGLSAALLGGGLAAEPKSGKELASFGVLRSMAVDAAKAQAQDWLKTAGKTDDASRQAFEAIWSSDRPVLDMVADTFALGNAEAASLLAEARNPDMPAPKEVPAILKDTKQPVFFRANLALAYAKALSNRRVYEEAREALAGVRPEQVVEPAAFFFHKAVTEHGMLMKAEATSSISRLLDDVADAPDRYKMVAALMFFDMQSWKDKDLAEIGRKMTNIERRLELARGGPVTQKMQKDVVFRLDELIKKLEKQQQGQGQGQPGNGGQCPEGGQPGSQPGSQPGAGQPTSPQQDSIGGTNSGPGNVDPKKLKELVETWGKLPERERIKAMTEMTRDLPPAYRQMIEDYFRKLASEQGGR